MKNQRNSIHRLTGRIAVMNLQGEMDISLEYLFQNFLALAKGSCE